MAKKDRTIQTVPEPKFARSATSAATVHGRELSGWRMKREQGYRRCRGEVTGEVEGELWTKLGPSGDPAPNKLRLS